MGLRCHRRLQTKEVLVAQRFNESENVQCIPMSQINRTLDAVDAMDVGIIFAHALHGKHWQDNVEK
jgi:hypothetical protein